MSGIRGVSFAGPTEALERAATSTASSSATGLDHLVEDMVTLGNARQQLTASVAVAQILNDTVGTLLDTFA